ncbi:hypothetical protein DKY64_04770 [Stenotrophomonas maltophilia]|nr:hypothetical protein DKY64_04770 [Stenotrophomonas maltophilia]
MNHNAIAHALCGRYTPLTEHSGYIESPFEYPVDGTLIGAYVLDAGGGTVRVTDDGDVAFHVAVAGAEITSPRIKAYRSVAEMYGISMSDDGVLAAVCREDELTEVLARYMQAAAMIAEKGVRHRPREDERFERIVHQVLLARYGERLSRRPEVVGLSGHILRFPFAIATPNGRQAYIQTVAAEAEVIQWKAVYEAGGKFKDVRAARGDAPLVAILEQSRDADRASRFFADTASVVVYEGGALDLDFALAA